MFGMHLIIERDGRATINWRTFALFSLAIGWGASFAFLGVVYDFDLDRNLFRFFFPMLLVLGSLSGVPLRVALRRRFPASVAYMDHLPVSEIVGQLATRAGLTEPQALAFCQAQAELSFELANRGFPIPGIGTLTVLARPAREMIMRFGPKAGKVIQVPAKRIVKFRLARFAVDAALLPTTAVPDVRTIQLFRAEDEVVDD